MNLTHDEIAILLRALDTHDSSLYDNDIWFDTAEADAVMNLRRKLEEQAL